MPARSRALSVHPLASLFPSITGDEYDTLIEDIQTNGLLEPITLLDGKILDGVHRFRACERAGVKPRFVDFKGKDPLAFVLSKNLQRRHLTASQRAAIAAEAMAMLQAAAKDRQRKHGGTAPGRKANTPDKNDGSDAGEAREVAAKTFGVSGGYIWMAKEILTQSPAIFERLKDGEITMMQAFKEHRAPFVAQMERKTKRFMPAFGIDDSTSASVKEYHTALVAFTKAASAALDFSKQKQFDPAGFNFFRKKHLALQAILKEIEGEIACTEGKEAADNVVTIDDARKAGS